MEMDQAHRKCPCSWLLRLSRDGYSFALYKQVVNTGDVMTLLSHGAYKPTIHRVRQPPQDQINVERLGVFYFAMAADNIVVSKGKNGAHGVTMGEWRKERTGRYGRGGNTQSKEETNVEQDEILGVVVKEYN